jgi:hypothetical protein
LKLGDDGAAATHRCGRNAREERDRRKPPVNDSEQLVRRSIAVWNERNAAQRRASIEATFTPDVS